MHPGEELKPRGFDRGLQAEKIIGATGKYTSVIRKKLNILYLIFGYRYD